MAKHSKEAIEDRLAQEALEVADFFEDDEQPLAGELPEDAAAYDDDAAYDAEAGFDVAADIDFDTEDQVFDEALDDAAEAYDEPGDDVDTDAADDDAADAATDADADYAEQPFADFVSSAAVDPDVSADEVVSAEEDEFETFYKHGAMEAAVAVTGKKKSRRGRIALVIVIVLLVAALGGLGWYSAQLIQQSSNTAVQQASSQTSAQDQKDLQSTAAVDSGTKVTKRTSVPNLVSLLGMNHLAAEASIGRGATVTATRYVAEEGNPVKAVVTVTLTEEPADTRTGTPTVYLSTNAEGTVIRVGYSAGTATLGYGALSFEDMVKKEKVIENTFAESGVTIPAGSVVLPESRASYTTFGTDGTTVKRELCSFEGQIVSGETPLKWDAVLLYDYTAANSTGNLANTLRQVSIYVGYIVEATDQTQAQAQAQA